VIVGEDEIPATYNVQDENREIVTVMEYISVDGRILPPLYICRGFPLLMSWHADVKIEGDATSEEVDGQ